MNSVEELNSPAAISGLLDLIHAVEPILDTTYGNGVFWQGSTRHVIRCDIQPERAIDLIANFKELPFSDGAFPTVVYDPPFHPLVGSREESRFSAMGHDADELKFSFCLGLLECWRVTSSHLVVKCQGFIHNHTPQWMPLWCVEYLGEPFEWFVATRRHKVISGRWVSNNSLRRMHADYLIYSKRGNRR